MLLSRENNDSTQPSLPRLIILVQGDVKPSNFVATAFEATGHWPLPRKMIHIVESMVTLRDLESLGDKRAMIDYDFLPIFY